MRKFFALWSLPIGIAILLWLVLFGITFLCLSPQLRAQSPLMSLGAGPGKVATAASYTGPGDVVASAWAWWGLRAYSAATRGNAAVNVCNPGDVACADLSTDATTGDLIVGTIGGHDCTADDCTVKIIYDQTAGNNCNSASCNVTNATEAQRPKLIHNCIGTKWCMSLSGSMQGVSNAQTVSINQPFTISSVFLFSGSAQSVLVGDGASVLHYGMHRSAANNVFMYIGASVPTASATDNAFHAFQGVFNNASSDLNVDGSANASNLGTAAGVSGGAINIGCENVSSDNQCVAGQFTEIGIWISAFSSGNSSSMSTNQHSYWGF